MQARRSLHAVLFTWSLFAASLLAAAPLAAQHQHEHPPAPAPPPAKEKPQPPQEHGQHGEHRKKPEPQPAPAPPAEHAGHEQQPTEHPMAAEPAGGEHGAHAMMPALLGPYPMTRESSGTSWQPDAAPHQGFHLRRGTWDLMLHGNASLVYDDQDGPRGDQDVFSASHAMAMASRPAGAGRLGLRAMLSAEPWTIGEEGYPLLLQTGETADGRTPLVDRQHPHDLFMELAATYSRPVGEESSVFVYLGLPGEPALGPPAFVHRFSGWDNPEAPLSHHWLDSTHITYGVATLGWVRGAWKLEGSLFTGREPDEDRTDIEDPKMDSWSLRASWQPSPTWSLQASHGRLQSPEQLSPDVDVDRTTISAIHSRPLPDGTWQTTLAWGRNARDPGETTDALLLESALALSHHTLFARAERLENDELLGHPGDEHFEEQIFQVGKVTLGYLNDAWTEGPWEAGVGALASVALIPDELEPLYGDTPLSWMVFFRVRL